MKPDRPESNSEGMILIVVLWAVSLMTLTVVALSALSHKSLSLAGAETDQLRSELALEAGLAAANALILSTPKDRRVFLDGSPAEFDVGGGRRAEIRVRDASGLIDFNRGDLSLVDAVVMSAGADPIKANALLEAIKLRRPERDDGKSAPQGEQNGNRQSAGNGQQQTRQDAGGNQPAGSQAENSDTPPPPAFSAKAELYGLLDDGQNVIDGILPLVTLYSTEGKINPLAAPSEVLRLVPGLDNSAQRILENAKKNRQSQTPDVQAVLGKHEKFLAITEPRSFIVSVRLLDGPGILKGRRFEAAVILDESGREAFQILDWSW